MAIFRKIHTSFWSDTFIQDLDNDHKLFYLYLLTNERTKQCGVYEISKKQISFDLGYSIDRVSKLLKYFIDNKKIRYSEATKELALKNWLRFNSSTSPKVLSCIKSELSSVKDRVLIEYIYSMDTASQEEQEKEEEQEQEQECLITPKVVSPDSEKIKEFLLIHFDEKYITPSAIKTIESLKKKYEAKDIARAVGWGRGDPFWSKNFLSPNKLNQKDKSGVLYIDLFLENSKTKTNGTENKSSTNGNYDRPYTAADGL
jgi:hypothetical protein